MMQPPSKPKGGAGGGNRRLLRVEKEMRQTVASYLVGGFRGQLQGIVTVSRVGVSSDLRTARVFVSVLGEAGQQKATIEALQEQAGDVQRDINEKLRMKHCPRITFELDPGLEKSLRLDAIFRDIELERKAREEDDAK